LLREQSGLDDAAFEAVELPISGTSEPIEMLVAGSLAEDALNLAVTVSDWNWPPVTICLLPGGTPRNDIRSMLHHPQVGRSIFPCLSEVGEIETTIEAALGFLRERAGWFNKMSFSDTYTINNISPRWLFESMMRSLDEYIYFKDAHGHFLAVSQYLTERCGRTRPSEILGKTDFEFFDARHSEEAYTDERKIATEKIEELHKEEFLSENGKEQWVLSHKFPLRTRSNFLAGTFGISRDITEAKQLQQAIEQSNARMKSELKLARNLQKTLMGRQMPAFTVGPEKVPLTLATKYLPSFHLSGDFYSCRKTPSGGAAFLVADVVGHGARAAMVTAMIQLAVQQLDHLSDDPESFMRELNAMIHRSFRPLGEPIFATAIFAVLDLNDLTLRFVQAGARHGATITGAAKREARLLPSDPIGSALGLLPDSDYRAGSLKVDSGNELFFYTDGLVEARNEKGEEFGESRMLKWLVGGPAGAWDERFDSLMVQLNGFTARKVMEDDICLLAVSVPKKGDPRHSKASEH